jgi:hypothetical protein
MPNIMAAVHITTNTPFSTSTPTPSHLLNLPPELRSRIFHFALLSFHPSTTPSLHACASTYLSLQLTSGAIRHETCLLPFRLLPVSEPAVFGSNISTTLRFLGKLRPWQVGAIRRVEISMLGSVFESIEARRVLKYLNVGGERVCVRNWIGSPDVAVSFFGDGCQEGDGNVQKKENEQQDTGMYASDLRELAITIISRDVMTPLADSAVGMEKMLDLDTSPVFGELVQLKHEGGWGIREIAIGVELGPSLKGLYGGEWVKGWTDDLRTRLKAMDGGSEDEDEKETEHAAHSHHDSNANLDAEAHTQSTHHQIPVQHSTKTPVNLHITFTSSPETSAFMSAYFRALGGDEVGWFGERGEYATEEAMGRV